VPNPRRSKRDKDSEPEILALSPDQVCRLTGLTPRQLRYWDDTEFFSPEFREEARRSPLARVYSFRDVVGLRALAVLRKVHRVPLQRLRKVGAVLRTLYDEPWSTLTFYVVGRDVYYQDEHDAAIKRADETGQTIMPFALDRVERDVRAALAELRRRKPAQIGRIDRHRHVAENRPVLAGTRVPTVAVWEFFVAGHPVEAILRQYPQLTERDVRAAVDFEEERRKRAS
jgi:uncharacterized protein (DUF433 family)